MLRFLTISAVLAVAAGCNPKSLIERHEGNEKCVYTDTTGHKTIGIGYNLEQGSARKDIKDVGADFDAVYSGSQCLTSSQVTKLFEKTLPRYQKQAKKDFSCFNSLCCNVQDVIVDMTFNLGSLTGWPNFRKEVCASQWSDAANNMKNTLWCDQVKSRCTDNVNRMKKGC